MNDKENWHGSDTSSTLLRMTKFEVQSEASRRTKRNTYGDWSSNKSLILKPEFVNDTTVTCTNNEKPKHRNKLMTRFGNPRPSLLPNLIKHTEVVGVPEWRENQYIFLQSRREELEQWNMFKSLKLGSNHGAGELERRILRTRQVNKWKIATDGSKEAKSKSAVRRYQDQHSILLKKFAPTVSNAA